MEPTLDEFWLMEEFCSPESTQCFEILHYSIKLQVRMGWVFGIYPQRFIKHFPSSQISFIYLFKYSYSYKIFLIHNTTPQPGIEPL